MKRLYFPVLLFCLLSTANKLHSQTIAQVTGNYGPGSYTSLVNYYDGESTSYQEVGQTFKSLLTTKIATIQFYMAGLNSYGTANLEIYSCSAVTSWGSLLGTINAVSITAMDWMSVDVSSLNISVTAGSYYGFRLIPQDGLNAGIGEAATAYPDGAGWANTGGWGGNYPFIITGFSTLPVKLASFTAQKQNDNVLVQWSTATEQNSKNFIVQHSIDGNNWINIATISAAGNSNTIKNYSYTHTNPANGINYYRLLQTDIDGKSSLSESRMVKFSSANPSFSVLTKLVCNGVLQVQINEPATLSLYSTDGRLFWKKQFNAGTQNIYVTGYAKGLYFLKATESTERIVIQ